jgi:hypothetical protein
MKKPSPSATKKAFAVPHRKSLKVEAAVNTVANVVLLKATPVNAKADREAKVKVKAKTNNAKNLVPPAIAGVETFALKVKGQQQSARRAGRLH